MVSCPVSDPKTTALLADGQACEHTFKDFVTSYSELVYSEIMNEFSESLKRL